MTDRSTSNPIVLSGEGIVKRFPGVVALDKVDFSVRAGEVHGLIGENGAGKSTLMHILAGVTSADEGVIRLDGKPIAFASPREATDHGVSLVHQELNLIPNLSVADNVFLGRELVSTLGTVQSAEQQRRCKELLGPLDDSIDPCESVRQLRVGQQQSVEIAKALNAQARVVFMDEPTSAISDQEVESLFRLVRTLRDAGVAIVYVSHKLDELFQICDRITVLRDGQLVDTLEASKTDRDTIVRLMVGRQLEQMYVHSNHQPSRSERLRVEALSWAPKRAGRPLVENVTFAVHGGEVLGVFGLMGAGRTELLEAIFGLHTGGTRGTVSIDGEPCTIRSPGDALACGLGFVPEDRKRQGLVMGMSVEDNISLGVLAELESAWLLSAARTRAHTESFVQQFSIRTPSVTQRVANLSGGNQQKVVLSKVMSHNPKVLLLDEPTRGIDVNAKREVYEVIDRLKQAGMAIVVVSSELPELLGIADRFLVLCEGRKTAELDRSEATEESLMRAAVPAGPVQHPNLAKSQ